MVMNMVWGRDMYKKDGGINMIIIKEKEMTGIRMC